MSDVLSSTAQFPTEAEEECPETQRDPASRRPGGLAERGVALSVLWWHDDLDDARAYDVPARA